MPNQQIMCTVSNCHYWAQGNHCDANQILVTSDEMGDEAGDRYDAPQASTMRQTQVQTCMDTCCKTFIPKGSNDVDVDGVYRG